MPPFLETSIHGFIEVIFSSPVHISTVHHELQESKPCYFDSQAIDALSVTSNWCLNKACNTVIHRTAYRLQLIKNDWIVDYCANYPGYDGNVSKLQGSLYTLSSCDWLVCIGGHHLLLTTINADINKNQSGLETVIRENHSLMSNSYRLWLLSYDAFMHSAQPWKAVVSDKQAPDK